MASSVLLEVLRLPSTTTTFQSFPAFNFCPGPHNFLILTAWSQFVVMVGMGLFITHELDIRFAMALYFCNEFLSCWARASEQVYINKLAAPDMIGLFIGLQHTIKGTPGFHCVAYFTLLLLAASYKCTWCLCRSGSIHRYDVCQLVVIFKPRASLRNTRREFIAESCFTSYNGKRPGKNQIS